MAKGWNEPHALYSTGGPWPHHTVPHLEMRKGREEAGRGGEYDYSTSLATCDIRLYARCVY